MSPKQTTIYTRKSCPFCSKVKQVFDAKGWSYTEYKLDENFTREQFIGEFGRNGTFPQLICDGEKTGGCNETINLFRSRGIL